jgi:ABC-type nitrate/sulfonate/bicarbonate transport system substrate-binding protein
VVVAVLGVLVATAVRTPAAGDASQPAALKVVYAQPSAAFAPLFVAQDDGFFTQQGIEPALTQVTGATAAAAVVSGEVQVLAGGATEVAGVDVAGASVVMLAAGSNYPIFSLYVAKSIRSVRDLVGKKIAVTKIGTSTDTTARIMLERYGLAGKVQIIGAGGTMPGILAMMDKGIAVGGVVSPPTTAKAAAAGFHELVNGFALGIPMTQSAVAVTRTYLSQHRGVVIRFMKAYLAAWAFIRNPAHRAATERAIAHYTRATPSQAAVSYQAFFPVWAETRVPRVDPRGVANVLRFSANERVRTANPKQFIDDSVLQELVRSGYVASLYRK